MIMIPVCEVALAARHDLPLLVIDRADHALRVGEGQTRDPDHVPLAVRQGVHVDVPLHVEELDPVVVPHHGQLELGREQLTDLVEFQNLIQLHLNNIIDFLCLWLGIS